MSDYYDQRGFRPSKAERERDLARNFPQGPKSCPDAKLATQGVDEIVFPEHQMTPALMWHNVAFYMDDVFIGYFSICSDGRMELDIQEDEKKLIAKKLVPMLAPFPSMVESISADIVLKSPLEM